jgi:glycerol-3-phosphate acyltransferase PlsX
MTGARIALDVMGGDHAPQATLAGAKDALHRFPSIHLLLVGDEAKIKPLLAQHGLEGPLASRFEVIHAPTVVDFHDEPKVILKEKKESSIRVCAQLVREGKADGMVSMGHTGAAMMASTLVIGKLEGVERPALAGLMPNGPGKFTILTDVGANIDSRAEHIAGFALMASIYAEQVYGIARPRVGVMSVGEEDTKGTETTLAACALLREMDLNFQGNAEGRDLWNGRFDVIACDGFLGNVVLKSAEGLGRMLKHGISSAIKGSVQSMLGGLLVQSSLKAWFSQLDYREYGGLPLLGIKGVSIIGHGSSDARAVMNGIGAALKAIDNQLVSKIAARMAPKAGE